MKKFIIKSSIYSFFVLIFLNIVSYFILERLNNSEFYKPQFVKNAKIGNKFDYVILGSSVGLTTLNSKQIDSTFELNGLNISMDDSSLNSHYLMLQHFYNCKKTTDKLVLCITPWDIIKEKYQLNNNDYRFLPNVNKDYISDYYYQMESSPFKKLYLSKYFPLIGVSYYNFEIVFPSLLTIFHEKKHNKFDDRGNFSYPDYATSKKEIKVKEESILLKNEYFDKIYAFCIKNNIELIVYQSPLLGKKINYIDISSDIKLINHSNFINNDMFYDNIHVNSKGRTFCTLAFCKEIKWIK